MTPPSEDAGPYFGNKGKGLNCLAVTNASSLKFYWLSSGNPGHRHDSGVFKESAIHRLLEEKLWVPYENALVVADSAYEVIMFFKQQTCSNYSL